MTAIQEKSGRSSSEDQGSVHTKTLVVGLGNPILGDDGVGWRVSERVRENLCLAQKDSSHPLNQFPMEVEELSLGGLSLMERLIGYQRAIIIDAITTQQNPLGTVSSFPLADLPNRSVGHLSAAHDTSLQTAIEMGLSMGAELPQQIIIVAIEAEITYDFSEELSAPIMAAVPEAERIVMDYLTNWTA